MSDYRGPVIPCLESDPGPDGPDLWLLLDGRLRARLADGRIVTFRIDNERDDDG